MKVTNVRFVHMLLVGLLLLASAVPAEAQYRFRTSTNTDGTVTVYKTLPGWQGEGCPIGDLPIPEAINGRKVTSIGNSAFSHCTGLTSVTIGNSVTSIGSSAFWGCPLKDILFNKSRTMLVRYPPGTTSSPASGKVSGSRDKVAVTAPPVTVIERRMGRQHQAGPLPKSIQPPADQFANRVGTSPPFARLELACGTL